MGDKLHEYDLRIGGRLAFHRRKEGVSSKWDDKVSGL